MRPTLLGTFLCLAALAASSGCLNVADDRAEMDREIGQASTDQLSVEVDGGLATIQNLSDGTVSLWAQAPTLEMQLETGDTRQVWEIRLENALADATLMASAPDGSTPSVQTVSTEVPTEKVWRVELEPQTRYVLRVAPPDADDTGRWHFAVFADVQDHIDEVQDIYGRMKLDDELRFCLISGDLTERGSPGELERFQEEMKTLGFPCYATLGNHELGTSEHAFRDFFGRGNFSFEFRGVRFTLLDSASATVAPAVYGWLDQWLDAGSDKLHAVMMHIPPLDPAGHRNGAFASRAEANKLLHLMADHGVDLGVYGHVHSYYAYSNAGIPSFISGGGGAIPERFDGVGRHYLKVGVRPQTQEVETTLVRIDDE